MELTDEQVEEAKQKLIDRSRQFRSLHRLRRRRSSTCSRAARSCSPTAARCNALLLQAEGEPVEWVAPDEGALSWVCGLGITSDAENIDAAYKLINYFVSKPAQAMTGQRRVRDRQPDRGRQGAAEVPRDRRPELDRRRDRRGPARQLPDLDPGLAGSPDRLSADRGATVAEARDLLAELVDIPSPSGSEGRIVDRIEELCRELGAARAAGAERDSAATASSSAADEPELAIAAHVDTIAPPWPAAARRRGRRRPRARLGRRQGRRRRLPARRPRPGRRRRRPRGARRRLRLPRRRGARRQRLAHLALALAPALRGRARGDRPARRAGRVGDIDAWVHVHGRSAHGALTELGENAIDAAVELIGDLAELELGAP